MTTKEAVALATDLPAPPDDLYAARMRKRFSFTLRTAAIACAVFATAVIALGMPWQMPIGTLVGGGLLFAIDAWARAGRGASRVEAAVHLMGLIGVTTTCWYVWFNGAQFSFALWFLALVPIAVVLFGSVRIVVLWTLVCVAAVMLNYLVVFLGVMPPEPIVDPTPALYLLAQLIFVVCAAAYATASHFANEEHVNQMRDNYEQLRAQKEQLDAQAHALQESLAEAECARQAADAANRAKSDFLAMMSHEIRTPLNGVVGLNSLLLSLPLEDRARHYAELGRQSGEALLALVNDFLDFSKIEAGHMQLAPVVFEPRAVVDDAVATVRELALGKGLSLEVDVDAPPALVGDAGRLRQVLVNLLGNAVKFTERGGVMLRGRSQRKDDGVRLVIDVIDTGIGMDDAAQSRLFQPFTQADATTTRRYGGTGLGLAICKALAGLMGGSIAVESKPGAGSTFRVTLPFAVSPLPAPVAAPAPVADGAIAASRGRVLVAEDNPVNQIVATEMLRRLGFSAYVVADGNAAIQASAAARYEFVLMDCDMPDVDGFSACRAIRARERADRGRHVPIIAMTASAMSGDRERCLAAGMDDYLAKPVRLADLERVVALWTRPAAVGTH